MYEELVKRLRNDAREQECLLHVCNSTMNAAEAADAIEALEEQLSKKDKVIAYKDMLYTAMRKENAHLTATLNAKMTKLREIWI